MIIPEIFFPYKNEIFVGFEGCHEDFSSEVSQYFLEKKGVAGQVKTVLRPYQTHSRILFSDENFRAEGECDGVYTKNKNTLCSVKTADCIGAIFYNPNLQIGATIHAGWRGLAQKIFTEFLQNFSPQDQKNFMVALSPSLGKCCAEFSDPYRETPDFFHNYVSEVSKNSGEKTQYFVDLWEIAKAELRENGIPEKNIEMPACCTKCGRTPAGKIFPENFWSHRNGDKERNGSFFMRY